MFHRTTRLAFVIGMTMVVAAAALDANTACADKVKVLMVHNGGSFMVRIEETKHPITEGLEDFEISDETYRNEYHPEFKLNSLVHMDRGDEQQSMAWVLEPGKGRMFNTTLGHGDRAFANPQFQRLVVRGMFWAAGLEPKDP